MLSLKLCFFLLELLLYPHEVLPVGGRISLLPTLGRQLLLQTLDRLQQFVIFLFETCHLVLLHLRLLMSNRLLALQFFEGPLKLQLFFLEAETLFAGLLLVAGILSDVILYFDGILLP